MTHRSQSSHRTMLITGAGKRVGAALAEYFAAHGWNLILHCHRSQREAQALAESLAARHGITATVRTADLRDNAALADFWTDLPTVHALIHNAATFERDTLQEMQADTLAHQLQVNFTAPLLLTQGFMKQLPADAQGSVVILGDGVMGWSISPEFFSYAVSKQAWVGTLDLLAAACAPQARVNMVALAPTLLSQYDTPEMFARLAERMPLKRTGHPQEVCDAVAYLMTAPGVTGQILSLAGGAQLQSHRRLTP